MGKKFRSRGAEPSRAGTAPGSRRSCPEDPEMDGRRRVEVPLILMLWLAFPTHPHSLSGLAALQMGESSSVLLPVLRSALDDLSRLTVVKHRLVVYLCCLSNFSLRRRRYENAAVLLEGETIGQPEKFALRFSEALCFQLSPPSRVRRSPRCFTERRPSCGPRDYHLYSW